MNNVTASLTPQELTKHAAKAAGITADLFDPLNDSGHAFQVMSRLNIKTHRLPNGWAQAYFEGGKPEIEMTITGEDYDAALRRAIVKLAAKESIRLDAVSS